MKIAQRAKVKLSIDDYKKRCTQKTKGGSLMSRMSHMELAIKHNLKYNRKCYLEQLAKPILGFYKIVLKDREDLLDHIINYTNDTLVKCGGKALRPSDFKIED